MTRKNVYIIELDSHFAHFDEDSREALKVLYSAKTNACEDLSLALCENAHTIREAFFASTDQDSWALAAELTLEHGVEVDIGWSTREAQETLQKWGCIPPRGRSQSGQTNLPGAFAALFTAPQQFGSTLITLLGIHDPEKVESLCQRYRQPSPNTMLGLLNLSEYFTDFEAASDIIDAFGESGFLGAPFMIIEMGGVCFWQEIFGSKDTQNIVGMMSKEEKNFESSMIAALMEAGLLFEKETEGVPLAIVPEELWNGLWSIAIEWIYEWVRTAFEDLEVNIQQSATQEKALDLQATIKWLALENTWNHLEEKLPEELRDQLPNCLYLASCLGAFTEDSARYKEGDSQGKKIVGRDPLWSPEGPLFNGEPRVTTKGYQRLNAAFQSTLDLEPAVFRREILNEWVCGFVSMNQDKTSFSKLLGLDEGWRQRMLEDRKASQRFVPPWMTQVGVPAVMTGHGYLRDRRFGDEELELEVELVNRIFQLSKLMLLDLMSLLKTDTWFSVASLSELFQMCCSASIFSHLPNVLDDPSLGLYIPLYRANFVGGEMESARDFGEYIVCVFTDLFRPLGFLSVNETAFCLHRKIPRIQSLLVTEEERALLFAEIFEDRFSFSLSESKDSPTFFALSEGVNIGQSMNVLRTALTHEKILSFDGRFLILAEDEED